MHDALVCSKRFRILNVDDFNRKTLAIEIDLNMSAQWMVKMLDRIVTNRGYR